MKRQTTLFFLLFLLAFTIQASRVDTIQVPSASMKKDVQVVTITPDKKGTYPVVYLLHGYGGNAKSWLKVKPGLKEIADREGIIFVCPDGRNSWYWDSPKDPSYRYETFVLQELVSYIDKNYSTVSDRTKRAITGYSMGGHGAMWLSLRHKDVFGLWVA